MTIPQKKTELLAPAGNFEKLEVAVAYGADAVYLAGREFSLRNFSGNFTLRELFKAVEFAHQHNVRVYIACNIYSRTWEQSALSEYLNKIREINPDALIVADPGIIHLAGKLIPDIPLHLSTQASTTCLSAVNFWKTIGITRVNLARELALKEIREIASQTDMEIETFIHGAMCISYSGRCLLSSFLSGRDSNRGLCSHPCRWKYSVVEEQRPLSFHPLMEDNRGSYIFNSKDLCMLAHIPALVDAGIDSFKIEGRMKGLNYLASVVKTYRQAIDACIATPGQYRIDPQWQYELSRVYHRTYTTGFYFNQADEIQPDYENQRTGEIHCFIGRIIDQIRDDEIVINVKNKISINDHIEILPPKGPLLTRKVIDIYDETRNSIRHAQPNTFACLKIDQKCLETGIVRKVYPTV
ncbi:MAG: U32 family peptidase [Thermodesulfobacteriota bacterium]|nr:U32 family peptidase [Thermodesulfobacteriota bacterium]